MTQPLKVILAKVGFFERAKQLGNRGKLSRHDDGS
jgi:hypothetical protein